MLASDVVALCDENGISELAQMFAMSTRQAEAKYVAAKRSLAAGFNPTMTLAASVRRSVSPQEPLEDDQAPTDDLESEAQARAARIQRESHGVAGASIAQLRSRLAVLERNLGKGALHHEAWWGVLLTVR